MDVKTIGSVRPGERVRISQFITERDRRWSCEVEGVVESVEYRKTGSWYAHGKNDRLWLMRVMLRKADGEQVLVNVDQSCRVTPLGPQAG